MAINPFPLPAALSGGLGAVRDHWRSLIRGDNNMPFWDDLTPSNLGAEADRCMLLDVFDAPLRFRFSSVMGAEIEARYGDAVRDKFSDEVDAKTPFEFLNAQGAATIEARAPTFYAGAGYARLLLPMWGEGRIGMVLVAFAWT
mgnify:CR=1 FL=1